METTYKVDGMTCGGCVASVEKALQRIGVKPVRISLEQQTATVEGPVDEQKVKQAVEAAGYDFGGRVG